MSQTDRQTDKATAWAITAWDDEAQRLADKVDIPAGIKQIYGGLEKCETTGKIHFQGHIVLRSQQRMSWFKANGFPKAHLGVARNFNASKEYAMKSDTAVGEKTEWSNPRQYLTMAASFRLIGTVIKDRYEEYLESMEDAVAAGIKDLKVWEYKWATRILVDKSPDDVAVYSNPQFQRAWVDYGETFKRLAREGEGAHSITEPPVPLENELISPAEV